MGADTLTKIPHAHHTSLISTDELALVWMDDHIVDRGPVHVIALQTARSRIPDLDSAILRTGDHPLAFAVECDTGDIVGVALEGHHRVGVCGLNVVELNIIVTSSREKAFVGGNAETVDLGVGVLNGSRTDAGQRFPEAVSALVSMKCPQGYRIEILGARESFGLPDGMVIPRCDRQLRSVQAREECGELFDKHGLLTCAENNAHTDSIVWDNVRLDLKYTVLSKRRNPERLKKLDKRLNIRRSWSRRSEAPLHSVLYSHV